MEILTLGEKIRKLRKEKNMSLRELGGDFVSKAQLSYIENGKASPNIKLLKYLAQKLDVDLEYLLETEKDQVKRYCKLWLEEMKIHVKLNNISDVEKIYKKIDKYAQKYNLAEILGENNLLMAEVYINRKLYDAALSNIQKSLYYYSNMSNIEKVIEIIIKEGNIYTLKGLYEIALNKYRQACSFYNQLPIKNLELKSNILYNISTCYHILKDKKNAKKYAEEVCKIDKQLKNKKRYTQSLLKYASTLILNKEYIEAENILKRANRLLQKEADKKTEAFIENNFGCIYLESGEYEKAYKHLIKAKQMKEEMDLDELPTTLFELYKYYLKIGQEEKAIKQLENAIEFSKKRELKNYIVKGLDYYTKYLIDKKLYEEAIAKIKEQISILEKMEMKDMLVTAYLKLGNTYSLLGKKEKALEVFKRAYTIKEIN
ncbi:helix-turn-helix domain-containing protein [Caloranaerobacter azorensis]|uniref:Helix-turn-helix domain-containing protein n=1 Tax=Caloranaerobacter azorensis TaxID=116090 RepID=A0A6P1Y9A7_9FIRM|nr:helix-turn-helix domain-containing protein [Caloranaerobacter azorensis]QIB25920.1 helix-turn-helix domain-containing protein [Caloranaerobacter azorensis]